MPMRNAVILSFSEFVLDTRLYQLQRSGLPVKVEPRVFNLLVYLARNRHRVVSKDELLREIWDGRAVTEASVTVCVSAARRALGDNHRQPTHIATLFGRGYRFIAPVAETDHEIALTAQRSPNTPLLGRDAELETLKANLTAAASGHGQLVLITGEPGIGKTRLTEEFSCRARSSGSYVSTGRSRESEGAPPYWPWKQLIRGLLDIASPLRATGLPPSTLGRLAQGLPDLSLDDGITLPSAAPRPPGQDRFQFFESVLDFVAVYARIAPLALIIDDLHCADEPSLLLLSHIARQIRSKPILLIGTFREADLQQRPRLLRHVAALSRAITTSYLRLPGLTTQAISSFVELTAGVKATADAIRWIEDRTGGNPLFLQILLAVLEKRQLTSWEPRGPHDATQNLPEGILEAIAQQLDVLPHETREILCLAAVIGRDFSCPTLAAAAGLSLPEVLAHLGRAERAGIVCRIAGQPNSLRFGHLILRDALYEQLPRVRRAQLHSGVAMALESAHHRPVYFELSQLAHHYYEAALLGLGKKAIWYGAIAGAAALERLAYEDAVDHYRRALDVAELESTLDDVTRCDLELSLAEALTRCGDRNEARPIFLRAASSTAAIAHPDRLARAALALAPGTFAVEAGISDKALIELLQRAFTSLPEERHELRARLAARLALALIWSPANEKRRKLVRVATESVSQLPNVDPELSVFVRSARWLAEWDPFDLAGRLRSARLLVADASLTGDRETALLCRLFLLTSLLEAGDSASFDHEMAAFAAMASQLGQPQYSWYSSLLRATRALMGGRLSEAEALRSEFAEIGGRLGDANAFHSATTQTILLRRDQGRLSELRTAVECAVRQFPEMIGWRAGLAWTYAELGDRRAARREFRGIAESGISELPLRFDWSSVVCLLSETCAQLEEREIAKRLDDLLSPLADRLFVVGLCVATFGSVARNLGLLAACLGRHDEAVDYLRYAIERNREADAVTWSVYAQRDLARILARGGATARRSARSVILDGLKAAARVGMKGLEMEFQSLIRDC
jgi:DNA-binding winged helix-turn-helix (wHTH) protein/tetratricopeptide (TPR) repeat protein